MTKTVDVELNKTEIELLHGLVEDHMNSGIYWGNKYWFETMQTKVFDKLTDAYAELENKQ